MKTAAFIVRMNPDERERLNELAREQRISLAHAMREGAKLYLQELQDKGGPRPAARNGKVLA
jgi:predicted DNA-binding protein